VTPVKALRLSHPREAELRPEGISTDRRFLLVDDAGWLVDATKHGPLQRIVPRYEAATEHLGLDLPGDESVDGPADRLGESLTADVYGRSVPVRVVEGPFGEVLSSFVERHIRLARVRRDGDAQDARPLSIVSSESVRDLGARGGSDGELDARRFRINLEVAGGEPYDEDSWDGRAVRVGEATIRVRGRIPRCVVTTLAPDTGERDFRTLTEIARYRPRIRGRGGLPFGMYADVLEPATVRIGDPVEPLERAR
jgi:uncharacterized protein YcbX